MLTALLMLLAAADTPEQGTAFASITDWLKACDANSRAQARAAMELVPIGEYLAFMDAHFPPCPSGS